MRLAGRYRLERPIAGGASAEVWRARDERLERRVAIKVLHRHLLPDAASRRRFATEARATAGLAHPGIVPVYDVVEDRDTVALVLQHVEGETLAERLARRGPIGPEATARIGAQLAAALDHAHRAGVIHRDVKPANVVLAEDHHARLLDFGIARLLDDAEARTTGPDQVVGTLRYMAPEQLAGDAVDARTDIYALGLVLAEMLTGRPVFSASTPAELLARGGAVLPDLDGAPPWMRTLIERMLSEDPAARPASARAVALALGGETASGVAGIASFPSVALAPEAGGGADPTVVLAVPGVASTPARSRPWRRAALPVGVLALVLAGTATLAILSGFGGAGATIPAESAIPSASAATAEEVDRGDDEAGGAGGDRRGGKDNGKGKGGNGKGKGRGGG